MPVQVIHKVQVWLARVLPQGEREVLLLRTTPERGGFWQPVTGKVEDDETVPEGAIRELAEETGVRIEVAQIRPVGHVFEFESRWGGNAREEVFLFVLSEADAEIRIDPTEHVAARWVDSRQAFSLLIHEEAKKALKKCLEMTW